MRARNIKPGFFKNEDLAECGPFSRLLFIGLWCMATREGVIEYRPKKIKAEIFPYEDGKCKVEELLEQLEKFQFISILEHSDTKHRIIVINNFVKHQNPHRNEKSCDIDNLEDYQEITGNSKKLHSPLMKEERGKRKEERGIGKVEKIAFGEFSNVFLKKVEFEKLKKRFGEDDALAKINALSEGIASKGYKYQDHYATILSWARKNGDNGKGNADQAQEDKKIKDQVKKAIAAKNRSRNVGNKKSAVSRDPP